MQTEISPAPQHMRERSYYSPPERFAFSLREAASAAGCSLSFLYAALKRGEGPRVSSIGRRRFVTREALNDWLQPSAPI